MTDLLTLESPRLRLRLWKDEDLAPFSALSADPAVMRYFPKPLSRLESAAFIGRVRGHFAEYGYGLWALERKDDDAFIGFTGLWNVRFKAPFTPAVEIDWRLARDYWGLGYASEAAFTSLGCAFEQLGLKEVVAFTSEVNLPSQKVMQAIGMQRHDAEDFEHPALDEASPLRRHYLYRIDRAGWLKAMHG